MAPISPSGDEIAGVAYFVPQLSSTQNNSTTDGTVYTGKDGHLVMINGTLIRILLQKPFRDSEANELLYVIVVIVFYATALMTLIITQIKRQRREGTDVDYYDEYLQRNQEVKRTCQTATTIVLKADPAPASSQQQGGKAATPGGSGVMTAASASAAAAAAAAAATTACSPSGERGSGAAASALLEPPFSRGGGGGVGGVGGGVGGRGGAARELSPRMPQRYILASSSRGGYGSGYGSGGGDDPREVMLSSYYTPSVSPRELSPMLESIPDIGT